MTAIGVNIVVFLVVFFGMEAIAWFTHKYIMHGFLWHLHADHHKKEHTSFFERNDVFFIIFATPSVILIYNGLENGSWSDWKVWFGFGITAYGICYFLVHDVFIHQRFSFLKKSDNWYLRGIRKAHKIHHKKTGKSDGSCFGMLFVPFQFYRDFRRNNRSF